MLDLNNLKKDTKLVWVSSSYPTEHVKDVVTVSSVGDDGRIRARSSLSNKLYQFDEYGYAVSRQITGHVREMKDGEDEESVLNQVKERESKRMELNREIRRQREEEEAKIREKRSKAVILHLAHRDHYKVSAVETAVGTMHIIEISNVGRPLVFTAWIQPYDNPLIDGYYAKIAFSSGGSTTCDLRSSLPEELAVQVVLRWCHVDADRGIITYLG